MQFTKLGKTGVNVSRLCPGCNGSNYGLEAVANHEIDEALGIGGAGSTLSETGSLTGPAAIWISAAIPRRASAAIQISTQPAPASPSMGATLSCRTRYGSGFGNE